MHRLQVVVGFLLCPLLQPIPAYAVWDYSLAAMLAMHDGLRTACGKIEPRLTAKLNNEWLQITRAYKIKEINTARKNQEHMDIYRQTIHEYLTHSWNDPEEKAHLCEESAIGYYGQSAVANQWWRDRSCTGVSLDSEEDGSVAWQAYEHLYLLQTLCSIRRFQFCVLLPH